MQSDPKDHAHLHTIKQALAKIERQVDGVDYPRFLADLYIADAVAMQLAVVGEAARKLSSTFKDQFPHVEWAKITGLRHLIAHEYEKLDPARLWDVAVEHAARLSVTLPFPPPPAD